MAITAADVALWAELRRLGAIPPAPVVVEIGQANWYGDVPSPDGIDTSTREGSFAAARAFWVNVLAPVQLDPIDLQGELGTAIPHDLNTPAPEWMRNRYDVLVNTGTLEHVFDQRQAWANCHDLVRPGGLMVHGLPWSGWVNHGMYNYQPGFILDLASANGYEIVLLWCTTINPFSFRPVFAGTPDDVLLVDLRRDSMLHVALRKGPDAPFRVPMQSGYAVPGPVAADWRSVPGWLSEDEGRALQALARGKRALELGAWKGRSTCCLAEAARNVITVDTFAGDAGTGPADTFPEWAGHVEALGHTAKVAAIRGTFADLARDVRQSGFDFAFVDGDHSVPGTVEACGLALRCVAPGGVVAVHDWHMESVREGAARCGLVTPVGAAGNLAWFVR